MAEDYSRVVRSFVVAILFLAAVAAGEVVRGAADPTPLSASNCEQDLCINSPLNGKGSCIDLSRVGIKWNCDMQADGSCRPYRCLD